MTAPTAPDTIVLIHGFWVTPRSWEKWVEHYERKSFRVLAPAYPGLEVEVEALNSAPTEGVPVVPLSQIKSTWAVLRNPANRHKAVGFTPEQWHYAFTNTFTEEESRALQERYAIPAAGGIFWDNILANIKPGKQETAVDYHNDARAALLFISGGEDHLMPPSVQRSNARHYRSDTVTEVTEFPGRAHLMPAQNGWEEVADYALSWALSHAGGAKAEAGGMA